MTILGILRYAFFVCDFSLLFLRRFKPSLYHFLCVAIFAEFNWASFFCHVIILCPVQPCMHPTQV
jgi:hypothetical protein